MTRNNWIGIAIFLAAAGTILGIGYCTGARFDGPTRANPIPELPGPELPMPGRTR